MEYMPKVVRVNPVKDYVIEITFSNGAVRLYDAEPIIQGGGVFESLKDLAVFREKLCVLNDTVAWGTDPYTCIDLDPITVYEDSTLV